MKLESMADLCSFGMRCQYAFLHWLFSSGSIGPYLYVAGSRRLADSRIFPRVSSECVLPWKGLPFARIEHFLQRVRKECLLSGFPQSRQDGLLTPPFQFGFLSPGRPMDCRTPSSRSCAPGCFERYSCGVMPQHDRVARISAGIG